MEVKENGLRQKGKEMNKDHKLCKDCKYVSKDLTTLFVPKYWKCKYTLVQNSEIDLVSGRVVINYNNITSIYCSVLREDRENTECCGSEGKWFESKRKRNE